MRLRLRAAITAVLTKLALVSKDRANPLRDAIEVWKTQACVQAVSSLNLLVSEFKASSSSGIPIQGAEVREAV